MRIEPTPTHRSAWLEIDLDALIHNVGVIAGVVRPNVSIAPVVKANAYGHGLSAVGPVLGSVSDALAVATLDEALALRAVHERGRIIVLYPVPPDGIADAVEADLELTLMSMPDLEGLAARVAARSDGARVHLAIETGMSRGGFDAAEQIALVAALQGRPDIDVVGVWTHLARANDDATSAGQLKRFEAVLQRWRDGGLRPAARHVAASEGIFAATAPALELVRPGLAVYGVLDDGTAVAPTLKTAAAALRPAMTLKARAVTFSDVPAGGGVGYGLTWRAARPSRVAILPLGYGDGYARGTGPDGAVLVRGRRVPIVGVISMDAIAIDVTDEVGIGAADEFVLLGRQGASSIDASELARWRNTITWEVLSSMAARLPRVYNRPAGAAI